MARPDGRNSRLSSKPAYPWASYRPRQRRNVRGDQPSTSAARNQCHSPLIAFINTSWTFIARSHAASGYDIEPPGLLCRISTPAAQGSGQITCSRERSDHPWLLTTDLQAHTLAGCADLRPARGVLPPPRRGGPLPCGHDGAIERTRVADVAALPQRLRPAPIPAGSAAARVGSAGVGQPSRPSSGDMRGHE